ncbi:MAG: hypothetical protein KGZ51_01520 [Erysipelothrix sp.]|jgi:hypothetical protein|nr:hypothetical protein [Erysipelothrix sp.]
MYLGITMLVGVAIIVYINQHVKIPMLFKRCKTVNSIYGPSYGYFSRKESWIQMLFLLVILVLMGYLFKLSYEYSVVLYVMGLCAMPLFLHYQARAYYHAYKFNQITTFLQHFLAHFKIYHQSYHALMDVKNVVDEEYAILIEKALEELNQDASKHPLQFLYEISPHFIIVNIMSWIEHVERHGVEESYETLDMLENDIDDWIEDETIYIKNLHSIKNKIVILVGLSLIIAMFNQHMLSSFMDLSSNNVYQLSIFVFISVLLLTTIKAYELLNTSWILKSECLWND